MRPKDIDHLGHLVGISYGRNVFNESVNGALLRDVVFHVSWLFDNRGEWVDVGIATRVNGAAPPEMALTDIDLGSDHFWSLDDAARRPESGDYYISAIN